MTDLVAAARSLHAALRDGPLVRMAPGVAPGIDLEAAGLHSVRESVLAALLDLDDGEAARAGATLDAVLALQMEAPGRPWHGTFPTTAEQPLPPDEGAIEWLHYDPNWRQFVGTVLAVALATHDLGPRTAAVEAAVARGVAGEPEGRIPDWYTNPALLHRWLQAWVGRRTGDAALVAAGEEGAARLLARVAAAGDVDEYSSPTYDGVDLLAAALWVRHAPTGLFAEGGEQLLAVLGRRIGALAHVGLGAVCGPYIRAYGLGLDRYVALVGLWLALAGAPADRVLPPVLDPHTDHVHDLAFAPLFASLADVVVPHLALDGPLPRHHVQRFGPVEAVSALGGTWAVGAERGRRPAFSREQYVPLTVHAPGAWLGVGLADGEAWLDATVAGEGAAEAAAGGPLRVVSSHPLGEGPIAVTLVDLAPGPSTEDHRGWTTALAPAGPAPRLRVEVGG